MLCPRKIELPLPISHKTSWPWTEESPQLPARRPDGSEWPKISIVTPNYNYGQFLEETIRSILLQGYPNLEYIIIDGGSTDNSLEIIRKYEPWLAYWESKPDRGQSHAINKGLERCTGTIFNWINSDDVLAPGALELIAEKIKEYDAFAGAVKNIYSDGTSKVILQQNTSAVNMLLRFNTTGNPHRRDAVYHQPGFWVKRSTLDSVGELREDLHYQFDFEFLIRYLLKNPQISYAHDVVVNFRIHQESKSFNRSRFKSESKQIATSILEQTKFTRFSSYAALYLKRLDWSDQLDSIIASNSSHRYTKLLQILLRSCLRPRVSWTRYTLGNIKALLLNNIGY